MEWVMAVQEKSLRHVVESWLGALAAGHFRVTRFRHTGRRRCRHVCVEATRNERTLSIVFFRHHDGSWCVFPPAPRTLSMGAAAGVHALL
jgi:hypothetical protein